MIYNLQNPYEIEKFKEYVNKLYSQRAIVEVKKKLPNRSLPQNSYLHTLIGFFACETGYSVDEVKLDIFKKTCNRDLFERKKTNKKGTEIKYIRSSSELTTGEMTTAIERFRNYSSAQCGLYLPAPNEHQFLIHIEQEIERNKEFI
jgi:hypothetical protein